MLKSRAQSRRFYIHLKVLYAAASLSLAAQACQTASEAPKLAAAREKGIVESQISLAKNSLDNAQPEKAHSLLRDLLQSHPKNQEAQNLMGLTQLALHNGSRAAKHFATAYRIEPKIGIGLNLSSALIDIGESEKAISVLNKLLPKAKRERYAYPERIAHNLGYAYVRLRNPKAAEPWFKTALEDNPTFYPSHLELARLYYKNGQRAAAILAFRRAIDHCLVCFEPVEALTQIYLQNYQASEASQILLNFSKQSDVDESSRQRAKDMLRTVLAIQERKNQKGPVAQSYLIPQ